MSVNCPQEDTGTRRFPQSSSTAVTKSPKYVIVSSLNLVATMSCRLVELCSSCLWTRVQQTEELRSVELSRVTSIVVSQVYNGNISQGVTQVMHVKYKRYHTSIHLHDIRQRKVLKVTKSVFHSKRRLLSTVGSRSSGWLLGSLFCAFVVTSGNSWLFCFPETQEASFSFIGAFKRLSQQSTLLVLYVPYIHILCLGCVAVLHVVLYIYLTTTTIANYSTVSVHILLRGLQF